MDPNETLRLILTGLEHGDADGRDTIEHVANLRTWIRNGGFIPNGIGAVWPAFTHCVARSGANPALLADELSFLHTTINNRADWRGQVTQ